jgi:hypothetical protein
MKRTLLNILVLFAAIALSACSRSTPAPLPTATATYSPLILLPTQAPTAQLPTPTLPPASTPTPSAYIPIEAEVVFDNYFLRTGPGRMFETIRMYDTGERVTLLAREPGNNWVLVQTSDHLAGWMNVVGLNLIGDVTPLPVFQVTNAQVLHGHVWTVNKTPATNVGVSIASVDDPNPLREDVSITNANGEWYLYLPTDYDGNWVVGVNSYGCASSAVDNPTSCALIGKFPGATAIVLPMNADVNIEFAFQK